MAAEFQDALAGIRRFEPVPWSQIPDLGLYMDQVITFIGRMYQPIYGDDMKSYLSAPMINNYVKGKLIPRPAGKKYSREQIALLTMIVALKQVSSMEDIRRMLSLDGGATPESLYNAFCRRFSQVIHGLRAADAAELGGLDPALDFAILASGYRAGCAAVLKATETEKEE